MHVNRTKPNIHQDMLAAAQGADLRTKNKLRQPNAKRQLVPKRSYPYSSTRQNTRRQRKVDRWLSN